MYVSISISGSRDLPHPFPFKFSAAQPATLADAAAILAFKRYWITSRLLCTNQPSFHHRANLHCPPWCNTIARLLGSIHPRPRPPVFMPHHTLLVITISCKGRAPSPAYAQGALLDVYIYIYIYGSRSIDQVYRPHPSPLTLCQLHSPLPWPTQTQTQTERPRRSSTCVSVYLYPDLYL